MTQDIDFSSGDWHRIGRKVLVAAHEAIVDAIEDQDPGAASTAIDDLFSLHLTKNPQARR